MPVPEVKVEVKAKGRGGSPVMVGTAIVVDHSTVVVDTKVGEVEGEGAEMGFDAVDMMVGNEEEESPEVHER